MKDKSKRVVELYKNDINKMSEMIFSNRPPSKENPYTTPANVLKSLYSGNILIRYNNDGYLGEYQSTSGLSVKKGQRLYLDDAHTTPIGYNIVLPKGDVKGVFVHVYGGFSPEDKEKKAFTPDGLSSLELSLLDKGVAVVTLNLPDLLKLTDFQRDMPESLHNEIHACIHKFYQTISKHPEILDDDLTVLKGKKMFLYGASFGGSMSMRHAELYPDTFSGYISHDGAVSSDAAAKTDRLSRTAKKLWLDPENREEMAKIEDPVLLMHNSDDNNVHIKQSLDFYNRLREMGKDLGRVCITEIGNPTPKYHGTYNKGHFLPTDKEGFERYAQTVLDFITKGPSAIPEYSEWQAKKYDVLANRTDKSAFLKDRFIAEVLDNSRWDKGSYKKLKEMVDGDDHVWNNCFAPLFDAFCFVDKLTRNPSQLHLEINRLLESGVFESNEMMEKTLEKHSQKVKQYMLEVYNLDLDSENFKESDMYKAFKGEVIKLRPSIRSQIASNTAGRLGLVTAGALLYFVGNRILGGVLAATVGCLSFGYLYPNNEQNKRPIEFILGDLYQSNPQLLQDNPNFTLDEERRIEAKEALMFAFNQQRKDVRLVWKAAVKETMRKKKKENRGNPIVTFSNCCLS